VLNCTCYARACTPP